MSAPGVVRACAARPVAVSMALVSVALLGLRSLASLPLGLLPELRVPRLLVEAALPGYSARDVRSLLACPLEDALASAKGLRRLTSVSHEGRVAISLDFSWGESPERAASQARELVEAAYEGLPLGASRPTVHAFDPVAEPLLVLALEARDGDLAFCRRLADLDVRARLGRVDGLGRIVVVGGAERELAVAVDEPKAAALGLTVADVAQAIARESLDAAAGSLRVADRELVVVARGSATSAEELSGFPLPGPAGALRLSSLARVTERDAARNSLFVNQGREAVGLELYARPGVDPVATARAARLALEELTRDFGRFVELSVVGDASEPIAKAMAGLAVASGLGALAAALALFWLLGDAKAGLIVASSIPLSTLATIAYLGAAGRSLNVMSLGGLGLSVGMVSDAAVIALDALASRFDACDAAPSAEEAAEAVASVLPGLTGGLATTAIVFVPVLTLPGAIGALFGDIARAVIAANLSAWLLSALALPAIYRALWRPRAGGPGRVARKIGRLYREALAGALRRPLPRLALAGLAALLGIGLALSRPPRFLPAEGVRELTVVVAFPPGYSLDAMAAEASGLCLALSSLGLGSVYGRAGADQADASALAEPGYRPETLRLLCRLAEGAEAETASRRLLELAQALAPPGVAVSIAPPSDPAARLLGLEQQGFFAVTGASQEEALSRAASLAEAIEAEAGEALLDIERLPEGERPMLRLSLDRPAAAFRGLSVVEAARTFRAATEGLEAARIESGGRPRPVRVFAAAFDGELKDAAGLPSVTLRADHGKALRAAAVSRLERGVEASAVLRVDRADALYLRPRARPGSAGALEAAIERCLVDRPWAARVGASALSAYAKSLVLAMALAVLLLYLTLGMQFESMRLPLLVMVTIPLAMAGAGPAMVAFGLGMDSGAVLGLVVLFGLSVNGAILLEGSIRDRRSRGLSPAVAAYAGALDRARPVVATALTTVLALAPVCLMPAGAAQRSMSATLLGGIVGATALTLLVSPIVYAYGGTMEPAPGRSRTRDASRRPS